MGKIVCKAEECIIKHKCGRYVTTTTDYQSHLTRRVGGDKCFMFEEKRNDSLRKEVSN